MSPFQAKAKSQSSFAYNIFYFHPILYRHKQLIVDRKSYGIIIEYVRAFRHVRNIILFILI